MKKSIWSKSILFMDNVGIVFAFSGILESIIDKHMNFYLNNWSFINWAFLLLICLTARLIIEFRVLKQSILEQSNFIRREQDLWNCASTYLSFCQRTNPMPPIMVVHQNEAGAAHLIKIQEQEQVAIKTMLLNNFPDCTSQEAEETSQKFMVRPKFNPK